MKKFFRYVKAVIIVLPVLIFDWFRNKKILKDSPDLRDLLVQTSGGLKVHS